MKNVHEIVTLGDSTQKTELAVHIYINLRMVYHLMYEKMPVDNEVFAWQDTMIMNPFMA